jgi:hypothetical protein
MIVRRSASLIARQLIFALTGALSHITIAIWGAENAAGRCQSA